MQQKEPATEWTLSDLIDFEAFLYADRDEDPAALEQRDATFCRDLPEASQTDRRRLFHAWTRVRREQNATESPAPGEVFPSSYRVLRAVLIGTGLLAGYGAAHGLLHYDGSAPVNVSGFLGLLVFGQVLLLALSLIGLLVFRRRGPSPVGALLRSCWTGLAMRMARVLSDRIPGEARLKWRSLSGALGSRRSLYGHVFAWPVATLAQWFGVFFNLAVLVTTLALVSFSDRAFGWQSALQFEPEAVHRLVEGVAAPWAGWGVPTVDEVAGSKIVLKDGIKTLATADLVSWWPFLCLSVAVYGLLPRLILLAGCAVAGRRALRGLTFDHSGADRLYERMTAPRLESAGEGAEPGRDEPGKPLVPEVVDGPPGEPVEIPPDTCVLILDAELAGPDAVAQAATERFRRPVARTLTFGDDPDEFWRLAASCQWAGGQARWVKVQEAWQPPIAESLDVLRGLRKIGGSVLVALVGRPGDTALTPASELERKIWTDSVAGLGDPELRVEALVDHE